MLAGGNPPLSLHSWQHNVTRFVVCHTCASCNTIEAQALLSPHLPTYPFIPSTRVFTRRFVHSAFPHIVQVQRQARAQQVNLRLVGVIVSIAVSASVASSPAKQLWSNALLDRASHGRPPCALAPFFPPSLHPGCSKHVTLPRRHAGMQRGRPILGPMRIMAAGHGMGCMWLYMCGCNAANTVV